MKVRFADCVLDADARTVCLGDATIHLSPKAFDLLAVLVEHRGRALSKVELLQRVWPDVFVTEGSLARVVREIRAALGDSPHDVFIVYCARAWHASLRSARIHRGPQLLTGGSQLCG